MLANRCSTAASMRATANSCSIICSTALGKTACGSIRVSTPFSATGCGKAGAAGRRLHQARNRLFNQPPQADERDFLALTFTMLKNHSYHSNDSRRNSG